MKSAMVAGAVVLSTAALGMSPASAAPPAGVVFTNAYGSSVEPLSLVVTGNGEGLRARLRITCGGAPGERDTWSINGNVISIFPQVFYATASASTPQGQVSLATGKCTGRDQVVNIALIRSGDAGKATGSVFTLFNLLVSPCRVDPLTGTLPSTCTTLPVTAPSQMNVLNN
jgi:hypothetical protein